jgi:hypothetical protein
MLIIIYIINIKRVGAKIKKFHFFYVKLHLNLK